MRLAPIVSRSGFTWFSSSASLRHNTLQHPGKKKKMTIKICQKSSSYSSWQQHTRQNGAARP
jgi:hypothetical protein